jgi:hypothetical protein
LSRSFCSRFSVFPRSSSLRVRCEFGIASLRTLSECLIPSRAFLLFYFAHRVVRFLITLYVCWGELS